MWQYIVHHWWQIWLGGIALIPLLWTLARWIAGPISLARLKKRAIVENWSRILDEDFDKALNTMPGFFYNVIDMQSGEIYGLGLFWIAWPFAIVFSPLILLIWAWTEFDFSGKIKSWISNRQKKKIETIREQILFAQQKNKTGISDASISRARMSGEGADRGISLVQ